MFRKEMEMNSELKALRKRIKAYFSGVKNSVRVFRYRKYLLVNVEYEDFYSEEKVEEDIRRIVGKGFLINVKREFSDKMMMDILQYATNIKNNMVKKERLNVYMEGFYRPMA